MAKKDVIGWPSDQTNEQKEKGKNQPGKINPKIFAWASEQSGSE